jgi:hypothetical protein
LKNIKISKPLKRNLSIFCAKYVHQNSLCLAHYLGLFNRNFFGPKALSPM